MRVISYRKRCLSEYIFAENTKLTAILGHYADYVRALHPQAPTPGFYRAERLFDDARRLRATMSDAAFCATLGGDQGEGLRPAPTQSRQGLRPKSGHTDDPISTPTQSHQGLRPVSGRDGSGGPKPTQSRQGSGWGNIEA